jgi:ABC-type nickel/cobalt efflux system permease component RcnA
MSEMMILGLLLIAAAVVVGTEVVVSNTEAIRFDLFGWEVDNASVAGVFLFGAVAAVVLLVGLWMLATGLRRARRRRLEVRQARHDRDEALRQQDEERRAIEAERDRLAAEKARLAGDRDQRVGRPERSESTDSGATRVTPRTDASTSDSRPVTS